MGIGDSSDSYCLTGSAGPSPGNRVWDFRLWELRFGKSAREEKFSDCVSVERIVVDGMDAYIVKEEDNFMGTRVITLLNKNKCHVYDVRLFR